MKKVALVAALVLAAQAAFAAPKCGTNTGRNDNSRVTASASPAPTAKPSGSSNIHAGVRH